MNPVLWTCLVFMLCGSCMSCYPDQHPKETGSFTDPRDGKTYKTVRIGDQWIMAENFAYRPDGGKYWAYDNDSGNGSTYGYLYDWETANNIAPDGWHLPSKKEWKIFRKSLGSNMEIMSLERKVYRKMIPGGSSGFNALFGGAYMSAYDQFREMGESACFWSSSLSRNGPVNYFLERKGRYAMLTGYADAKGGKSVRLFKD
jgi:uncharacterized protein (TIGR02145 family)